MSNKPGYFDIKRDSTYPRFCEGCLVGKTEEEMSKKDVRYCVECQAFIEQEYALIAEHRGKPTRYKPVAHVHTDVTKEKTKMSTLNCPSLTVDNFRPRGRPKTYKKHSLPDDIIRQLNRDGMGSKAIATLLNNELGVNACYKTIQRVLSGERK